MRFRLTEEIENKIENFAEQNNMKVHFMINDMVGVVTNKGFWQLVPSGQGVKVMHGNSRSQLYKRAVATNSYHDQHRQYDDVINAMRYIRSHDAYTCNFK